MDGGIQPERPSELGPYEIFWRWWEWNIIPWNKGKTMCDTYGLNPRLLPLSKNENLKSCSKI
jgi:hypothetical protein